MTNNDKQLVFDFDAPVLAAVEAAGGPQDIARPNDFQLRQAVLAHLVRNHVTGAALRVPSCRRKFQADIAAYWSEAAGRINQISCCAMIDIHTDRAGCLPECTDRSGVARELIELRRHKQQLEARIRETEPELRETDELFAEFQSYAYSRSADAEYHKVCRRLAVLHQALFKGTRMERLSRAGVADFLYLAVPENLIAPEELFDGWGLWYVTPELTVREVKPAVRQDCDELSRRHLVQNIGQAALNSVLFAQGVRLDGMGAVHFTRPPRRRRQ